MNKILFLLTIIFILFFSCTNADEATIELSKQLKDNHIDFPQELQYCIIIPGGGCDNCIAEGISFVKNNFKLFSLENIKIQVVFTAISSKKLLLNQLKIDNPSAYNIIFDSDDKYYLNSPKAIYPCIIQLEKGKIKQVEYQCPENPYAIIRLTNKINNK